MPSWYIAGNERMRGAVSPAAAPTYTGPGDIMSFTAWRGLRAYSGATASPSTKAATVFDVNDTLSIDLFLKTDGTLNTSGLNGAHTFKITDLYDQTGGGLHLINHLADATTPVFLLNTLGGKPVIKTVASNSYLKNATGFGTVAQPWSISIVFQIITTAAFQRLYSGADSLGDGLATLGSANQFGVLAGAGTTLSGNDGQFHSLNARVDDVHTDSKYSLNGGAATSHTPGNNSFAGEEFLGSDSGALDAYYSEIGFVASINDTNLVALGANQAAFYGSFPQ